MTHRHITGWAMPQLQDGDVIDGGNFSRCELPDLHLTFIDVNLYGTKENVKHTYINCKPVDAAPVEEPEPIQDIELAAKAELVLQSLISSGKLNDEMIGALNQLLGGVKAKANVQDIELGQAATLQTLEIIYRLKQNPDNIELATQIEQALQAVQAIWGAQ